MQLQELGVDLEQEDDTSGFLGVMLECDTEIKQSLFNYTLNKLCLISVSRSNITPKKPAVSSSCSKSTTNSNNCIAKSWMSLSFFSPRKPGHQHIKCIVPYLQRNYTDQTTTALGQFPLIYLSYIVILVIFSQRVLESPYPAKFLRYS